MLKQSLKLVALAGLLLAPIFAFGCASSQPYSVTGNQEIRNRARWTDDKGRYRADWEAGINRPASYPKNIAE